MPRGPAPRGAARTAPARPYRRAPASTSSQPPGSRTLNNERTPVYHTLRSAVPDWGILGAMSEAYRGRRTGDWVDARGAMFCETKDGKVTEMRMYWHRYP